LKELARDKLGREKEKKKERVEKFSEGLIDKK